MLDIFFYIPNDFDPKLWYEVIETLNELHGYFVKMHGKRANDAKINVFEHAVHHYDKNKGNLTAYLKSLCSTALKPNLRYALLDEAVLPNVVEDGIRRFREESTGSVEASIEDIIEERMMCEGTEKFDRVCEYALSNMQYFLLYVRMFIDKNTAQTYFPESFKLETNRVFNLCKAQFHPMCISIYNKHKDGFLRFMADNPLESSYKQLDMGFIQQKTSKRVVLKEKGSSINCTDPDKIEWEVFGSLSGDTTERRIIKVPYRELYEKLCDLVDEDGCNAIKYTVGDSYIFRTLGGSLSLTNISLFAEYDILKQEIVTNLLQDYRARLLAVGSECVYMLQVACDGEFKRPKDRVIRGIPIQFREIDVTPV